MTNNVVDEASTFVRGEPGEALAPPTTERGAVGAAWHRTAFLTRRLVVTTGRATAVTALTAIGCSLLVAGVGRSILRIASRLGADALAAPGDRAPIRGIVVGALTATARSWERCAQAVTTFTLAVVVWAVPLSFLSVPVLLAVEIEPTARIASLDREVSIDSWGWAIACAVVGAALLMVIPRALRQLVAGYRSPAHGSTGGSLRTETSGR